MTHSGKIYLASKVLSENSSHPLHTAKDCAMDHDRVLLLPLLVHVAQVEPHRELEVQLDGGALVLPLEGVLQGDVDLWPVEGSIARIQFPGQAGAIQRSRQICLSLVPHLKNKWDKSVCLDAKDLSLKYKFTLYRYFTEELLRPGGESQLISEAKHTVHVLEEVKAALHFGPDLVWHAEDVGIILLEPPHPGQPSQSS